MIDKNYFQIELIDKNQLCTFFMLFVLGLDIGLISKIFEKKGYNQLGEILYFFGRNPNMYERLLSDLTREQLINVIENNFSHIF